LSELMDIKLYRNPVRIHIHVPVMRGVRKFGQNSDQSFKGLARVPKHSDDALIK